MSDQKDFDKKLSALMQKSIEYGKDITYAKISFVAMGALILDWLDIIEISVEICL